jgi:hypothetical protein
MEAMLGISLYSYPYHNYQKCFIFLFIAYVFSSTKLEISTEQVLPRSKGQGWERGHGAEMTQTMYAHVNK